MLPFKGPSYAKPLSALHALCFAQPWSCDNFTKILNLPTTFGLGDEKAFILCSDLGEDFEILTLAVHPDHRRKGLASALLTDLQTLATQNHKHRIFLEVKSTNTPAISLYLKAGFVQTGCRKNYYHEGNQKFDALCFTWEKSPTD